MTFYAVEDIAPKHPADGVEVRIDPRPLIPLSILVRGAPCPPSMAYQWRYGFQTLSAALSQWGH
jgi:hypothetical protein